MANRKYLPLLFLFLPALFALTPAAALPPADPSEEPVSHGDRLRPQVALTFDICQAPGRPAGFDREIIDILLRYQVPATLFLGGDWMVTHPAETQLLAGNPLFELADHSWDHPDFRTLNEAQISEQMARTRATMLALTGRTPALFRFPYGYWKPEHLRTVAAAGLQAIQWDVETGDPDPQVSAEAMRAAIKKRARNGSIIIMHANGRGRHTAEALPGIIDDLQRRGLILVTVSELLAPPPVKAAAMAAH